jgi:hypothetical protein
VNGSLIESTSENIAAIGAFSGSQRAWGNQFIIWSQTTI